MLSGKSLRVGVFHGDDKCSPVVVVAMFMPEPDCKLTLSDDVLYELSEFGLSVVVSGSHAILG